MEETVSRYCAAWNAHDVDALLSMQTDDMVFHLHLEGSGEVAGAEALRAQYAAFFQVMPDYRADPTRTTVRGDLAVVEYTIAATLAEPFPIGAFTGLPGRGARFEACDILRLACGKVARKDVYVDAFALRAGWGD
ncbi:nuclear transport factor 2 family protein [Actinokineospora guangxiensis]|uniref:Nuclear transport factor 2 family protein n=1 Tax=Actinokineospora guangxiensis TaxID=1490288 RepID=A0ABW0EUK9_9PSEU